MSVAITAADYGGTVPVASILCPDDGDDVKGDDVQVPTAALLANDAHGLTAATNANANANTRVLKAGDTMTGALVVNHANGVVTTGKVEVGTTLKVDGGIVNNPSFTDGMTVPAGKDATLGGPIKPTGTGAYHVWRTVEIDAADATATLSTDADIYYMANPSNAATTYTLKSTSPTPPEGARITLQIRLIGVGETVEVEHESTTVVVTFGEGYGAADFLFIDGVWRLGPCSGNNVTFGAGV
jgi:hypothetical protein